MRLTDREIPIALFTDLYELGMLEAYFEEGLEEEAVFSLFVRRLPEPRNFLVACGLDDALRCLEDLRFEPDTLEFLGDRIGFGARFLDWLGGFRFRGDVHALPEGTPCFPDEPLLEVVAPLAEAQLVETVVMNQVHLQTVIASKAARVVAAARGRRVIDFGMRRSHGVDAAMKSARASYIAGVDATSNLAAARAWEIPVAGTMAHSYVEAHDRERDAFRSWAAVHPGSVLLLDTYDTTAAVRKVVELAREHGDRFRVRGVRLDSGDLAALARRTRTMLDRAGLESIEIFASGGLDEHRIAALVEAGAPIDGFGVGTRMGVASDAPGLDMAYKLVAYAGRGRTKLSPGKEILPGRKQVFRVERDGEAERDVIARHDEEGPGRPLLRPVMRAGRRTGAGRETPDQARDRFRRESGLLPGRLRSLARAEPGYRIEISDALRHSADAVRRRLASTGKT